MAVRVALVGLGLIGRERLAALTTLRGTASEIEILGAFDPGVSSEDKLWKDNGLARFDSLELLLKNEPDWVFVAVPHDIAGEVVESALGSGSKVLVEKPLGRNIDEASKLSSLATEATNLRVGFNYRFFAGISALLRDVRDGWFGELVSLEVILGHGGSPADKDTWKLDPVRAGGGCLIDPGVHVLDLCRLIAGQLEPVGGTVWSGFWNTGIEEECHLILKGERVGTVDLTLSVVRWRSTFKLRVNGTEGYGEVNGRGRSYGPQSYRRGRRWGWQGGKNQEESEELVIESDGSESFVDETRAVLFGSDAKGIEAATGVDAKGVMELLARCRQALGLPVS